MMKTTVLFMSLLGSTMGLKVETARPREPVTMKSADPNLRFVQQHDSQAVYDRHNEAVATAVPAGCPEIVGDPDEDWMQTLTMSYACATGAPRAYNWCKKDCPTCNCGPTCMGWSEGMYPVVGYSGVKPNTEDLPGGGKCGIFDATTTNCEDYALPAKSGADAILTEDHLYCPGCQSIFIVLLNPQCYLWGPCWGKSLPQTQWSGFNDSFSNFWMIAVKCLMKFPVEAIQGRAQMAAYRIQQAAEFGGPMLQSSFQIAQGAWQGFLSGVTYIGNGKFVPQWGAR
jgi:hypothetical protein